MTTCTELVAPKDGTLLLVPTEKVSAMLASCANAINEANTIEDAKQVAELADALAAMTKQLDVAKEIKNAAIRLMIRAEKKLGKIMLAMPLRTQPGKCEILKNHGIDKRRSSIAQQLAKIPDGKIDKVIDNGATSMHAVQSKLGLLSDNYHLREKRLAAYKLLCEEAISLLRRSVEQKEVPHAGTVSEMIQRLKNIQAQGFAK